MRLSILLYGLESERAILDGIKENIQYQLDYLCEDDVEALFYIDNGETSIEEKKQWLLEQSLAKKYVFINSTTEIKDNFLLLRYNAIKTGWKPHKQIELGIYHKN